MKKIDWYIIRKFLITFFFAIFLFAVISVVIDVGEKTDAFVKSGWTFVQIVMNYYIAFVPHIIALLFPLFVFIAVIFFTSKMAGRSEIIAILASGTSLARILQPYFLTSVLLGTILYYGSNYVIPKAEVKRTYFEDVYVHGNSGYDAITRKAPNLYYRIDSFTYAGIRNFDTSSKSGGPFYMYRIQNHALTYNLRATTIAWDTAKKTWRLEKVLERTIDSIREHNVNSATKWMRFSFRPSDLRQDDYAQDKMTTPELQRHIYLESLRGGENINTFKIELYRRQATPVSVIILTMIGAVIASKRVRGGSGAHIAIGFITAALFILMDRFSTIFSTKGNLSPLLAAWIPNIIFSFVALILYRRSPK